MRPTKKHKRELNCSRWLEAHSDGTAGILTLPNNAVLADVVGDGDYCLIITDLKLHEGDRSKVKVYKGISSTDIVLLDVPNSLIVFYTNQLEPKIPAVAVACGPYLYVYKNNKPFYKFRVPSLPVFPAENEFWKMCNEDETSSPNIEEALKNLKAIPLHLLSGRTQEVVCGSASKLKELLRRYNKSEPSKETPITCMTVLKKSSHDEYAVACPVIATESGHVYILEPQTLAILHQANVCSKEATPFVVTAVGLFDVEYRIIVGCREKRICVLRKDWLEGKLIIQLINNIIDIIVIPGDSFLIVATDNNMLNCYTKRGQNLWSIKMIDSVTCLCLVPLRHLSLNLVAVGLKGGKIHLYHGRQVIDYISVPDTPSVIVFGQLGQEENVMVVITIAGTLIFKILKRTADFNLCIKENIPVPQSMPLPLPKRSKWFLEQSLRERNTFVDMHRHFQQDLVNLRLKSTRELVNSLSVQPGLITEKDQIKLSAQVLGLGPKFCVTLTLENMHFEKPLRELIAVFHTQPTTFIISSSIVQVPFMPPRVSCRIKIEAQTIVHEINSQDSLDTNVNPNSAIKVYIIKKNQAQPIIAATVNMPSISETLT